MYGMEMPMLDEKSQTQRDKCFLLDVKSVFIYVYDMWYEDYMI